MLILFPNVSSQASVPAKHHKPFHQAVSRKTSHFCSQQNILSIICFSKISSPKIASRKTLHDETESPTKPEIPTLCALAHMRMCVPVDARRGCELSEGGIVLSSTDMGAQNRILVLFENKCSQSLNHLSSPSLCLSCFFKKV